MRRNDSEMLRKVKYLESKSVQKLTSDARIALQEYGQLLRDYEESEADVLKLSNENKAMRAKITSQRMRLQEAELALDKIAPKRSNYVIQVDFKLGKNSNRQENESSEGDSKKLHL